MEKTKTTKTKTSKTAKTGLKSVRKIRLHQKKSAEFPENKKMESAPPSIPARREKFLESIGRRKTSLARVRLFSNGSGKIIVNDKDLTAYFVSPALQFIVKSPLVKVKSDDFNATVKVKGGGIHSQAEAIRHGIARAILLANPGFRKRLKRASFLKRDPRMKERRKFGLKKARKAPQWSKR